MKTIIYTINNVRLEIWISILVGWIACWITMKLCALIDRWSQAKIKRDRRSLDAEYEQSLERMKVKSRPLFEMEIPPEAPTFPLTRGMKKRPSPKREP